MLRERLLALPADATYFELLGVAPAEASSMMQLTAARRAVALAVHPDRDPSPAAAALMAQANRAFDVLSRTDSMKRYLAELRSTHTECGACQGRGKRAKQRGFKAVDYADCSVCKGSGFLRKRPK